MTKTKTELEPKRSTQIITLFIVQTLIMTTVLLASLAFATNVAYAEPEVTEPFVKITHAAPKAQSFSIYNITIPTSDGGRIIVLFVWQLGAEWKWPWRGESVGDVFDTPLTLQMLKFFQNGTLDFAFNYSPLYLIQYDDNNGNGLLDLGTRQAFRQEVTPNEIEWLTADVPLVTYSLTPVFQFIDFERGITPTSWRWQVGSLQNRTITVDNTETYEFSWDASARVPTLTWSFTDGHAKPVNTAVNVYFGFHLILAPDKPQIKYDFEFSDISWAEGKNVKLALFSAIQYHSKETPKIGTDDESYEFDKTWRPNSRRANISENITNTTKAFITYRPDAIVDGSLQTDAVKTSFQPLFLIPTYAATPPGVYIQGMSPDLTTHEKRWRSYVAFSHQLGLPRFDNSLSQDPIIGVEAPLLISGLGLTPNGLLTPQTLTLATVIVTVAVALFWLNARRSPKQFENVSALMRFLKLF